MDKGLISAVLAIELCKDKWEPLRAHYKIDKSALVTFALVARKYPSIDVAYQNNKVMITVLAGKIYPIIRDLSISDQFLVYRYVKSEAVKNSSALQLVLLQKVLDTQTRKLQNGGITASKKTYRFISFLDLKFTILLFQKHHRYPGYLWSWTASAFAFGCLLNMIDQHLMRSVFGIIVTLVCLHKAKACRANDSRATARAKSWRAFLRDNERPWIDDLTAASMSSAKLEAVRQSIREKLAEEYERVAREH